MPHIYKIPIFYNTYDNRASHLVRIALTPPIFRIRILGDSFIIGLVSKKVQTSSKKNTARLFDVKNSH